MDIPERLRGFLSTPSSHFNLDVVIQNLQEEIPQALIGVASSVDYSRDYNFAFPEDKSLMKCFHVSEYLDLLLELFLVQVLHVLGDNIHLRLPAPLDPGQLRHLLLQLIPPGK